MKIAVVGAGFYGCHTAIELSKNIKNCNIDLYDKDNEILTKAIFNNQHRLHLGYHYPRCSYTIEQAIRTHGLFLQEYSDCVDLIEKNIYAIHKDSLITAEQYIDIFSRYPLNHSKLDTLEYKHLFSNINDIKLLLATEEKKINLSKLIDKIKAKLSECKNINIIKNCKVLDITNKSEIVVDNNQSIKYDYVINTTYYNPSMGLSKGKLNTKSELCFLSLLQANDSKFKDTAITICDGEYASLYPADINGTFTLSNVKYTPFYKDIDVQNLLSIKQQLTDEKINNINDVLFNDSKKYINIDINNFKLLRTYVTIKTKLQNDLNDYRGSYYIRENNNFSFMCGKISAILELSQKLVDELKME